MSDSPDTADEASTGGETTAPPTQPSPPTAQTTRYPSATNTTHGWYYGPLPPSGPNANKEGFGRAFGMSVMKGAVGCVTFLMGIFFTFLIVILVFAGILGALIGGGGEDVAEPIYGEADAKHTIASVSVRGPILGDFGGGLFAIASVDGYAVKQQLIDAAEDKDIDAVVLELQTPGGTIFGSQAISDGVLAVKESGKPIYAFVEGLSASGGMWAMAPADKIYADEGSLIGSIGVTAGTFVFYNNVTAESYGAFVGGVETAGGITYETFVAGRGKDYGSPYRLLTEEERANLNTTLQLDYDLFVNHVAEYRGIEPAFIVNTLGALLYGNQQAEEFGLIDGTLNKQATYDALAKEAGIEGDFKVIEFDPADDSLFGLFGQSGATAQQPWTGPAWCLPPNTALAFHGDPASLCPAP